MDLLSKLGHVQNAPSPAQAPMLDRLLGGQIANKEAVEEVMGLVYAGLRKFCDIPSAYRHCRLDVEKLELASLSSEDLQKLLQTPPGSIINPERVHLEAIEFFKMLLDGDPLVCEEENPLRPSIGAYLVGPPGVGKTHVMAAYALHIHALLDRKLGHLKNMAASWIRELVDRLRHSSGPMGEFAHDTPHYKIDAKAELNEVLSPRKAFERDLALMMGRIRAFPDQPTDLLYLGFDELCELHRDGAERSEAQAAIENARIVFIDDIHPKGNDARLQVVQHLIERRYELGRLGTFITSNLDAEKLVGSDGELARRLNSRCSELFVKFDFRDCKDWRVEVKSRKVRLIEEEIRRRLDNPF